MEINLRFAQYKTFTELGRAIFNVLKSTLQYPAEPQTKALKLADDIKFFHESAHETSDADWVTWCVVLDIACCIPPDHPWQDSLQGETGRYHTKIISCGPGIFANVLIALEPPEKSEVGEELVDECDDFCRWRNYNSFIARITRDDFNF